MDEYPVNRSEPDTSVNAGRPGRSYFPQGRFGPGSEWPTIRPLLLGADRKLCSNRLGSGLIDYGAPSISTNVILPLACLRILTTT